MLPLLGAIYFLTVLPPKFAPKSLTFSESFTLAVMVALQCEFTIRNISQPRASQVGSTRFNILAMLPWLALVASGAVWLSIHWLAKKAPLVFYMAGLGIGAACYIAIVLEIDGIALGLSTLMKEQSTVVTMALLLGVGLALLYDLSKGEEGQLIPLGDVSNQGADLCTGLPFAITPSKSSVCKQK